MPSRRMPLGLLWDATGSRCTPEHPSLKENCATTGIFCQLTGRYCSAQVKFEVLKPGLVKNERNSSLLAGITPQVHSFHSRYSLYLTHHSTTFACFFQEICQEFKHNDRSTFPLLHQNCAHCVLRMFLYRQKSCEPEFPCDQSAASDGATPCSLALDLPEQRDKKINKINKVLQHTAVNCCEDCEVRHL